MKNLENLILPNNFLAGKSESGAIYNFTLFLLLLSFVFYIYNFFYFSLLSLIALASLLIVLKFSHIIFFKRNERGKMKLFSLEYDFSWNEKSQTIEEHFNNLSMFFSKFNSQIRFVTTITDDTDSHISKEHLWKYGSKDDIHYFNAKKFEHLALMKSSETQTIIDAARNFGLKINQYHGMEPPDYIGFAPYLKSGKTYFLGRYLKKQKYFSILYLSNSKSSKPFQISDLLYSINGDISVTLDLDLCTFRDIRYLKNVLSHILASERLKRNRGRRLSPDEIKLNKNALTLSSLDRKDLFKAQIYVILRSDNPQDLRELTSSFLNKASFLGLTFNLAQRKRTIKSLLGDFDITKPYIVPKNNVIPLLPFLCNNEMKSGIPVGFDPVTRAPQLIDLFNGNSYNILILGETGSGKSYFASLLLSRILIYEDLWGVLLCDPMKDYVIPNGLYPNSKIVINRDDPKDFDSQILKNFMVQNDMKKVILIDEAHKYLSNENTGQIIIDIVRTSRHYNTSVILVTQDSSSFLDRNYISIFNNSAYLCIFRNKIWENLKEAGVNPSKYGYDQTVPLIGGKNSLWSEMLLYSYGKMKKIMISDGKDQLTLE